MLQRSPSPAVEAVSALLLELERHIQPAAAREIVADMLADDRLSERIRAWLAAEAKLPPRAVQPLREAAGAVVRLRKRGSEEALAELRSTEPGFAYFEAPPQGCRFLLAEAKPTIWSARVCGLPTVPSLSWCATHLRRVVGKGRPPLPRLAGKS